MLRWIALCLKGFSKRWRLVRHVFQVLTIVRFGLLTVAIIAGSALMSQQVADILRALVEDSGTSIAADVRTLALFLSAFLCGLMVWYGARTMLRFRFMGKPGSAARVLPAFKRQLPRALAAAVPFTLALKVWALAATGERPVRMRLFALALLVEAAALFAFVLFRRDLARRLHLEWLGVPYDQLQQDIRQVRDAGSKVVHVYLVLLALNVAFMVLFTLAPGTGRSIGSMAILMIALTLVNATGSVIVYVGNRYRIPALSMLLMWALLSSFTSDNHRVRTLRPDANRAPIPAALTAGTLEDYFLQWLDRRAATGTADRAIPVFLVSAEGGGIRAAYWTAAVLGQLEDDARRECLPFAPHVFAISGVSGGSLGAAVFAAALQSNPAPRADSGQCASSPSIRRRASQMLSQDVLSPTVAAGLFPDLFQRFVPVPFLRDRAAALEHAWESAWADGGGSTPDAFRQPFADLWSRGDYLIPLLFLNSTVVESGQRALIHPLRGLMRRAEGTFAPVRGPFTDALHVNDVLPDGLALSTAVHLSARFTYVSPAGRIDLPSQQRRLRLVDGGYFDNSGAVTMQEIFAAIEHAVSTAPDGSPARRVWPIVIHISNEPASDPPRRAPSGFFERHPFAPELLSPVRAMFATRSARGFQARDHLIYDICGYALPPPALATGRLAGNDCTPEALDVAGATSAALPRAAPAVPTTASGLSLHFRLYEGNAPLPLGWALSSVSRTVIDRQLNSIASQGIPRDVAAGKYNDPLAVTAIAAVRCYNTGRDCAH
jgi:hypothetical protein